MYYAAISSDAKTKLFGVTWPDFPGCVTVGDSFEEAIAMGTEAIRLHISGMLADNDPIPQPSSHDAARATATKDCEPGEVLHMVPFAVPMAKRTSAKRVIISMQSAILDAIDAWTRKNGGTRSGMLAHAALAFMANAQAQE